MRIRYATGIKNAGKVDELRKHMHTNETELTES